MADHDRGSRPGFSHPEVVRDLMLGFVRDDILLGVQRLIARLDAPGGETIRRTLAIWLRVSGAPAVGSAHWASRFATSSVRVALPRTRPDQR